ncbi:Uncharacterised protein [Vibrio cholerae]|nr:Uncharacterised protein [Vibrio cholerae]
MANPSHGAQASELTHCTAFTRLKIHRIRRLQTHCDFIGLCHATISDNEIDFIESADRFTQRT